MSRKKAIRRRQERPLANEKSRLPPDAEGNRQQRRLDKQVSDETRAAVVARTPDQVLELLEKTPNWESLSPKKLGKLLGVRPERAKVIRQAILSDELYQQSREADSADGSSEPP